MAIDGKVPDFGQLRLDMGGDYELLEESSFVSPAEAAARSEAAMGALMLLIKDRKQWEQTAGDKAPPLPEDGEMPKWLGTWIKLLNQGFPWRHAAYIAWASSPKIGRWPENQDVLARQVLGLTSDRVISTWRQKNPAIEAMIATLQAAPLMDYRADAFEAHIKVVTTPDYKATNERKLFFAMTDDYIQQLKLNGVMINKGVEGLSDAELAKIAQMDPSVLGAVANSELGDDEGDATEEQGEDE